VSKGGFDPRISDPRRDMAVADAVLAVLKNTALREDAAIETAKAIMHVIERHHR
jgi:hypothetical protein